MENAKIILENGSQANSKGIFYIFNSKYYFLYTLGEQVDNDYIQLYVVQVCKEVKNTSTGSVDTGYMIGMETTDTKEWGTVQTSITKIVDDKKNGTISSEIQYLKNDMLANLKIVSKNKLKLMQHVVKDVFNLDFTANTNSLSTVEPSITPIINPAPVPLNQINNQNLSSATVTSPEPSPSSIPGAVSNSVPISAPTPASISTPPGEEVIVDYRAKFFEEQDKNQELEEKLRVLQEKLDSVKNILN